MGEINLVTYFQTTGKYTGGQLQAYKHINLVYPVRLPSYARRHPLTFSLKLSGSSQPTHWLPLWMYGTFCSEMYSLMPPFFNMSHACHERQCHRSTFALLRQSTCLSVHLSVSLFLATSSLPSSPLPTTPHHHHHPHLLLFHLLLRFLFLYFLLLKYNEGVKITLKKITSKQEIMPLVLVNLSS